MAKDSSAVLDVARWRLVYGPDGRVVCRPGILSFVLGLVVTAAMAGGIVWLVRSFGPLPGLGWDGRPVVDNLLRNGYTLGVAVMAFVGVLAPLSRLWARVVVWRDAWDRINVSHRGLVLGSRWSWPAQGTSDIVPAALETRAPKNPRAYYRWVVQMHGEGGQGEESVYVCFIVGSQTERPRDGGRPPARVGDFARALSALTGARCLPCAVRDRGSAPGIGGVRSRRLEGTPRTGATVQRRTYGSLDEMPPELRAKAERTLQEGAAEGGMVAEQTFTFRDGDGREHRYRSLDEMPPEVRARFEEAMRRRGR